MCLYIEVEVRSSSGHYFRRTNGWGLGRRLEKDGRLCPKPSQEIWCPMQSSIMAFSPHFLYSNVLEMKTPDKH